MVKDAREFGRQIKGWIGKAHARLIVNDEVVAEAPWPGSGSLPFPGWSVEEGVPSPNATVEVIMGDGQKQEFKVLAYQVE